VNHALTASALAALLALAAPSAAQDAPPPAPAPPAEAAPPPLPLPEVDRLLLRGQRNLALHGLSLAPDHLHRAIEDFRRAWRGLPADADANRRFDASFSLAFALCRGEFAPETGEARAQEVAAALTAASAVNDRFPGLSVVDGIVKEAAGDVAGAADAITKGLDALDAWQGLEPWQSYQLRFFGHMARGRAFLDARMNRAQLAEKDFERALALGEQALLDPLAPADSRLRRVVLTHLAAAKQALDYYSEAERILEFLVKDDPANGQHSLNLGFVLASQFRFPEAVEAYRRASARDPGDPRPRIKIAYILLRHPAPGAEPDIDEAASQAEMYRGLVGAEDAEYACMRGELARLRGEKEKAADWFRRALRHEPQCQTALLRLVQHLGLKDVRTADEEKELLDLKRRLDEGTKKRGDGTMAPTAKDAFC
jgi:tetratricopeptide (TPR) repeat protein